MVFNQGRIFYLDKLNNGNTDRMLGCGLDYPLSKQTFILVMDWTSLSLSVLHTHTHIHTHNSYVEALTSNAYEFGDGDFKEVFKVIRGHKSRNLGLPWWSSG